MPVPVWYPEDEIREWLRVNYQELEPLAPMISQHLQVAYEKGWGHGFTEGQSKQAIFEIQGRERFLKGLKKVT